MSVQALQGLDYDGGHDENRGLSEGGEVVPVPLHRHLVSMDLFQIQLSAQYAFGSHWIGTIRLPFASRSQETSIERVEDATTSEIEAMRRNSFIHHRNQTYDGIGDIRLLLGRQAASIWKEGDWLLASAGLNLPTGETQANPWTLGAQGRRHDHIQLGTGTVDPSAELRYLVNFTPRWGATAGTSLRASVYENDKGYRGPLDVSSDLSARYRLAEKWTISTGYHLLAQGYAHWDGERDHNTGVIAHSAQFGLETRLGSTAIQAGMFIPLAQDLLLDDGDGFEPGPTFVLSLGRGLQVGP